MAKEPKVEDALSYLDKVKHQFIQQPHIYNEFLDIMKEFKSQIIDTPGVIHRVKNLFKGNNDLIIGFNAFLPTGYKIELSSLEEHSSINKAHNMPSSQVVSFIHQPYNTHSSTPHIINRNSMDSTHMNANNSMSFSLNSNSNCSVINPSTSMIDFKPISSPINTNCYMSSTQNSYIPIMNKVSFSPTNELAKQVSEQPTSSTSAINYVSKVRTRFLNNPEIYQSFLNILSSYQSEQKVNQDYHSRQTSEKEVYKRVASLFQNHTDLLEEFSQFLPETGSSIYNSTYNQKSSPVIYIPNYNELKKTPTSLRQMTPINNSNMDCKINEKKSFIKNESSAFKTKEENICSLTISKLNPQYKSILDDIKITCKSIDEYHFVLHIIDAYNKDIITINEFTQLFYPLIKTNQNLVNFFNELLKMNNNNSNSISKDINQPIMNPNILTYRIDRGTSSEMAILEFNINDCEKIGASYRALPGNYPQLESTGRTRLCKEVLNDIWVSIPSWSEDTPFFNSKKTTYEEFLHGCEEERFELDVIIQRNYSTLNYYETHYNLISQMTPYEQEKYSLDMNTDGSSDLIRRVALERLYGERVNEITEGLKLSPHITLPIIIKRLKSKDHEWRQAKRLFDKVWREQTEKYYIKALDHIGHSFKQTDPKTFRGKKFITEIFRTYNSLNSENIDIPQISYIDSHLTIQIKSNHILDHTCLLLMNYVKSQSSMEEEELSKLLTDLFDNFISKFFNTPLTCVKQTNLKPINSELFFADDNLFIFIRLIEILNHRVHRVYDLANEASINSQSENLDNNSIAVLLNLKQNKPFVDKDELFLTVLELIRNLIDGKIENCSFEDGCREMLGINSYILFTIDKLFNAIYKQILSIFNDLTSMQLIYNFSNFTEDIKYCKSCESLLQNENCYRISKQCSDGNGLENNKPDIVLYFHLIPAKSIDDLSEDNYENESLGIDEEEEEEDGEADAEVDPDDDAGVECHMVVGNNGFEFENQNYSSKTSHILKKPLLTSSDEEFKEPIIKRANIENKNLEALSNHPTTSYNENSKTNEKFSRKLIQNTCKSWHNLVTNKLHCDNMIINRKWQDFVNEYLICEDLNSLSIFNELCYYLKEHPIILRRNLIITKSAKNIQVDMFSDCQLQIGFEINSYRMKFVANTSDIIYKITPKQQKFSSTKKILTDHLLNKMKKSAINDKFTNLMYE